MEEAVGSIPTRSTSFSHRFCRAEAPPLPPAFRSAFRVGISAAGSRPAGAWLTPSADASVKYVRLIKVFGSHYRGKLCPLFPPIPLEIGQLGKFFDVTQAKIGNQVDLGWNFQQIFDCPRIENADPSDAYVFSASRKP
jgi:hypothetical protein